MKKPVFVLVFALVVWGCYAPATIPSLSGTPADRESLKRTTAAIRDAFARGDVEATLALHHPEVVKYFGSNKVTTCREMMQKQLIGWLSANKVEFI